MLPWGWQELQLGKTQGLSASAVKGPEAQLLASNGVTPPTRKQPKPSRERHQNQDQKVLVPKKSKLRRLTQFQAVLSAFTSPCPRQQGRLLGTIVLEYHGVAVRSNLLVMGFTGDWPREMKSKMHHVRGSVLAISTACTACRFIFIFPQLAATALYTTSLQHLLWRSGINMKAFITKITRPEIPFAPPHHTGAQLKGGTFRAGLVL